MTRLFPASAMYTVPLLSTATAAGSLSPAKGSWLGAGWPFGSSSTWLEVLLAIYTFPAVSTATPPAPSSPPHGNARRGGARRQLKQTVVDLVGDVDVSGGVHRNTVGSADVGKRQRRGGC